MIKQNCHSHFNIDWNVEKYEYVLLLLCTFCIRSCKTILKNHHSKIAIRHYSISEQNLELSTLHLSSINRIIHFKACTIGAGIYLHFYLHLILSENCIDSLKSHLYSSSKFSFSLYSLITKSKINSIHSLNHQVKQSSRDTCTSDSAQCGI